MTTVYAVFSNEFFYGPPANGISGYDTVTVNGQTITYSSQGYFVQTATTQTTPPSLDYEFDEFDYYNEGVLGSGYTTSFTGGFSNGNGGQIYLFENTVYEGVFSSPPPEVAGAINPPNYTETLWYPEQVYVPIVVNLSVDPSSVSQSIALNEDASGKVTNAPLTGTIAFTDDDVAPTGAIKSQTVTATNAQGVSVQLTSAEIKALEADFSINTVQTGEGSGSVNWTYNPDGTALNFLTALGDTAIVSSTIAVSDQDGNTQDATVNVTVTPATLGVNIHLGSNGYGTMTVSENGQILSFGQPATNPIEVAYDQTVVIPNGTYTVLPFNSNELGWTLAFSTSSNVSVVPGITGAEIHIGNSPGDSADVSFLGTELLMARTTTLRSAEAADYLHS